MIQTIFSSYAIQLLTILQGVLLARLLGVEGRGEFYEMLFYVNVLSMVMLFGLNIEVPRIVSMHGSVNFGAITFLAGLYSLVSICFIYLLNPDGFELVLVLFLVCNIPSQIILSIYLGAEKLSLFNILRGLFYFIFPTMLICFSVISEHKVSSKIVMDLYVSALVGVLVIRVLPICQYLSFEFDNGFRSIRELLVNSARLYPASLMPILGSQYDKALLVSLYDSTQVGLYVVAYSVASIGVGVANSVGMFLFNRVASSDGGYKSPVLIRFTVYVMFVFVVGVVLLGEWLIGVVYGTDFLESGLFVSALAIGAAFYGVSVVLEQILRASGDARSGVVIRVLLIVLYALVFAVYKPSPVLFCYGFSVVEVVYCFWLLKVVSMRESVPISKMLYSIQDYDLLKNFIFRKV